MTELTSKKIDKGNEIKEENKREANSALSGSEYPRVTNAKVRAPNFGPPSAISNEAGKCSIFQTTEDKFGSCRISGS
jgi:hypothetical protein